jgi:catechol 2,3-dioxygenase-like lactoylglutathione lyase family enzyme
MTEQTVISQVVHRWYTRPVFFVADVNRAVRFYVDMLGFEKGWHEGDGAGKVCQVITESARSSSVRTQRVETEGACSSS